MILICNSKAFEQYTSLPESFKLKLFSYKIRENPLSFIVLITYLTTRML